MAPRCSRLCAGRGRVPSTRKESKMQAKRSGFWRAAHRVGATLVAAWMLAACSSPAIDHPSAVLSADRVAEIVASPDRSDADRRNDLRRKPVQMLEFIGIRPGMVVLDVSAGGGYTTEL